MNLNNTEPLKHFLSRHYSMALESERPGLKSLLYHYYIILTSSH